MATKSGQQEPEKAEVVEELLDALDAALDRVKVLYEQYFLGIQKQPPRYLHTDAERKIRDLTQLQVRNTALRYRFATLQQKFGSYNAYWRRTLRQIENGTYTRNLSKVGRQAAKTGAEVPEEILAAMPKRMREQVRRDREAALAIAARRGTGSGELELLTLADEDLDAGDREPAALVHESAELRRHVLAAGGAHKGGAHEIDESDAELDLDAFFASVTSEGEPPSPKPPPPQAPQAPASPLDTPVIRWRAPAPAAQPRPQEAPPTGPRPVPPRVVTPPAGATSVPRSSVMPPPRPPTPPRPTTPATAPSQATRPIPIAPGTAAARGPAAVETLAGPFPRLPSVPPLPSRRPPVGSEPPAPAIVPSPALPPRPTVPRALPVERPAPVVRQAPPPGMTEADVEVLYAKYVQAKQTLGEDAGPGAYRKLVKTIHEQAPKIMEQYKSQGVDFSVVVKDHQVILRAKPKP